MTDENVKFEDVSRRRLTAAVGTISESIGKMAAALNTKLDCGEKVETKELKELTSAAKELSAVIQGLDGDGAAAQEENSCEVRVSFDGGCEKWAE